jgi:hypothetical protein
MMLLSAHADVMEADDALLDDEHHDRRRGLRVREQRPVKIFSLGTGRYYGGQTEDISATGLRIELPMWAPLRTGETLNVHVGLNGRGSPLANRRHMVPARVVWVNRRPRNGGRFEVGVEFLNHITAGLGAA